MTAPAGVCRFCGCSHHDPCPLGCGWTDRTETVCTACAPAAKAERLMLDTLRRAGYRTARPGLIDVAFVEAVHQGFLVGWFAISKRSPYGRNPWAHQPHGRSAEAWDLGQQSGSEAVRSYRRVCGPLENAPRRSVLRATTVQARGDTKARPHDARTAGKHEGV